MKNDRRDKNKHFFYFVCYPMNNKGKQNGGNIYANN